jgi:hypothetical protein
LKTLKLSNGKEFMIDDEDYELVSQHKWYHGARRYVISNTGGYLHRLLMSTPKGMYTDHINGNPLDNRKSNLRVCTNRQNISNMRKKASSSSKYKGVSFDKSRNKWRSIIMKDYKYIQLGRFNSEVEAARAYNEKAKELFGEFASLNTIEGE